MGAHRQSAKRPPPQQDRSRETLQRVLKATEELLADQPLEQITVRQILARSGVSTGSFYARFSGKDELMTAIWDELKRTVDDFLDDELNRFKQGSLADRTRFVMEQRVKRFVKYRGVFRTVIARGRMGLAPISTRDRREYESARRRMIAFFMQAKDEIRHPQPERAITMGEFATASAARELILFPEGPHASTVRLSRKAIVNELTRLFLSYLQNDPTA